MDERDLPPEDIVLARLPHFSDMMSRLMTTSSFKVGPERREEAPERTVEWIPRTWEGRGKNGPEFDLRLCL